MDIVLEILSYKGAGFYVPEVPRFWSRSMMEIKVMVLKHSNNMS